MRLAEITEGYVYVLINPRFTDWIKVGKTNNIQTRLYSYQIASPFRDYEIYYTKKFRDYGRAEKIALSKLKKKAEEQRGEWFKMDRDKAIPVINSISLPSTEIDTYRRETTIGEENETNT